MKIYKNKDTGEVIVTDIDKAWAIYGYPSDNPLELAGEIVKKHRIGNTYLGPCKLIYNSETKTEPEKPTTEQPTDTNEQKPKLKNKGKTK